MLSILRSLYALRRALESCLSSLTSTKLQHVTEEMFTEWYGEAWHL